MPAYPAAHPHHMPGAQILKPERIAGRHASVHVRVLFLWAAAVKTPARPLPDLKQSGPEGFASTMIHDADE
jgi:hypothetical protein